MATRQGNAGGSQTSGLASSYDSRDAIHPSSDAPSPQTAAEVTELPAQAAVTSGEADALNDFSMPTVWSYPLDLGDLGFGGNLVDPSWLLGSAFGLDALTSSMPSGSPDLNSGFYVGDLSPNSPLHRNIQGWDPNHADAELNQASGASLDSASVTVHSLWHTRPKTNIVPQDSQPIRDGQEQVDDTYRAQLSTRLAPSISDGALPSADLLVSTLYNVHSGGKSQTDRILEPLHQVLLCEISPYLSSCTSFNISSFIRKCAFSTFYLFAWCSFCWI